jgi:hypothetical protein
VFEEILTSEPPNKKVSMAKKVARSWLEREALPEHRLVVYIGSEQIKNLPALLKSFRDGKSRLDKVPPIKDLGVKVEPDKVTFKSRDRESLQKLDEWLVSKGCETSGVT